jgi:hypothetical protein
VTRNSSGFSITEGGGIRSAGATNVTLVLPGVQLVQAGSYAVVVTNVLGLATSSNASLPFCFRLHPALLLHPVRSGMMIWTQSIGLQPQPPGRGGSPLILRISCLAIFCSSPAIHAYAPQTLFLNKNVD